MDINIINRLWEIQSHFFANQSDSDFAKALSVDSSFISKLKKHPENTNMGYKLIQGLITFSMQQLQPIDMNWFFYGSGQMIDKSGAGSFKLNELEEYVEDLKIALERSQKIIAQKDEVIMKKDTYIQGILEKITYDTNHRTSQ